MLFGLPSGHTAAPTLTLPFGVRARVVAGSTPGSSSRKRRSSDAAHSPHRHLRHRDGHARRDAQEPRTRRPRLRPERLSADERLPARAGDHAARGLSSPSTSVADLDLVVVGNAISRGNVELEEVLDRKIRYCSLPEAVRDHFLWGARSVVIAGTHGKTTTTSLTGWLLAHGGADPSVLRRRHRRELRRQLSHRRRARVRHRGGRVRQRLLRQDGEVPQVPARHRRRQQHRVRPRRHLPGPRRDPPGVPAVRQPGAAPRAAAARRRQRRGAGAAAELAKCRVETFGLSGKTTGRRTICRSPKRRRRSASGAKARRSGPSRCRCSAPTTSATRWPRSRSAPPSGLNTDTMADGLRRFRGVRRRMQLRGTAARRDGLRRLRAPSDRDRRDADRRPVGVSRRAASGRSSSRARRPRAAACFSRTSRARSAARDHVILPAVFRSTLPDDRAAVAEADRCATCSAPDVDARYIPQTDDIVRTVAREAQRRRSRRRHVQRRLRRHPPETARRPRGARGALSRRSAVDPVRIVAAGDAALVVELPQRIDPDINARARSPCRRAAPASLAPSIRDAVVGYCTLTVYFDPLRVDALLARGEIRGVAKGFARGRRFSTDATIEVPVCYGGELRSRSH